MPIISVRIIKKPRAVRYCPECHKELDGETIKLFGMAFVGEKPYSLYLHRECIVTKDAISALKQMETSNDPQT